MLRSLRWETRFVEEFAEVEPDARIRDEIMAAIDIALAAHPERGLKVPGTIVMALAAKNYVKTPFLILYVYDDAMVRLHRVIPIETFE